MVKSDLAWLVIDYQNTFDTALNNISSEVLDSKNTFTKLESDLEFPEIFNNKLVDQVTRLERKTWENKQYSRWECVEVSGIHQSTEQKHLKKTVLNDFDKRDAPVDRQNIEACHKWKSDDNGRSNKVIAKFS